MSVKLRLQRFGKRGKPVYRIVAIDESQKRQGKEITVLGHYNPLTNPPIVKIDKDKLNYWLKNGAQPTNTVRNLIKKA
jgi:small subunit ribosomal protein S16